MFDELNKIKRIERKINATNQKFCKILNSFKECSKNIDTQFMICKIDNLAESEIRTLLKIRDKSYKKLSFIEKFIYHLWKLKED